MKFNYHKAKDIIDKFQKNIVDTGTLLPSKLFSKSEQQRQSAQNAGDTVDRLRIAVHEAMKVADFQDFEIISYFDRDDIINCDFLTTKEKIHYLSIPMPK